jgi:hypothetical protein
MSSPPSVIDLDWVFKRASPEPNSGCWLWVGKISDPRGYARTTNKHARTFLAHRLIYEALRGPVPLGLQLDHKCRVRSCVNPDHLEPVTQLENIRRGEGLSAKNRRKTHCDYGHPFSGRNLLIYRNGKERVCRVCAIRRQRITQARIKARKNAESGR